MKKYITITTLFLAGTASLCAATYTWTGSAGDRLWGNSSNWDLNNGYYPQSDSDIAVVGENMGTITWTTEQPYFGASNAITLGKGSEISCQFPNNSTGDFKFNTLNLYGVFSAEGTNALGFGRDFTVNFGDITETSSGLMDLSGFTGMLWGNSHTVTLTASAKVKGIGEIELLKFGASVYGGSVFVDTDGIAVSDADGNALTLNSDATSVSDLSEGEYALLTSTSGSGGVSILYSAPIPEPSAFGVLAGVGALALVAARRRRR